MANRKITLKDSTNTDNLYPATFTSQVFNEDGENVDTLLSDMENDITALQETVNTVSQTTVTSGQGTNVSIGFVKINRICMVRFANGNYTASANETLATVPEGYRPYLNVDGLESYGGKRIQISTSGAISCISALSNTPVRGTFVYITE